MKFRLLLLLFLLSLSSGLLHSYQWGGGEYDIRENFEIRRAQSALIFAATDEVLRWPRRVYTQQGSEHRVAVEVKSSESAYYILFTNEEVLAFPLYSRGSWIIKRDILTGGFLQVKIFYMSEPGSYIRIFPLGDRTLMDVYLFDQPLYQGVPLGKPFSDILRSSFGEVIELSRTTVDWAGLVPPVQTFLYGPLRSMVEKIRPELSRLPDAEDGAMDKEGKLVSIETLAVQERLPGFNCSGFAKWVADGIYHERTGRYLDIEEIKQKPLTFRGSEQSRRYEKERDPFFGLDWTRNLASFLNEKPVSDVRDLPYWKYRENIGFSVKDLKNVLYFLALREPNTFYFGSVNREFGTNPVLRQHIHVVVLFPYFNERGIFTVVVLERNVETSLESLFKRYKTDFIHLVGTPATETFVPPVIE